MEIGDYVRYKYENYIYIGKIKFISEVMSGLDETLQLDIDNCMEEILKENIIKSSPNIIDLIEVGDIITYEYETSIGTIVEYNVTVLLSLLNELEENPNKYKIKKVITKEQIENQEYEVK